jgi:asparagine synthase (glutamine-hydrolysing)
MEFARQGWAELRPVLKMNQYIAGLARDNTKVSALELAWYLRNQLLRDADWAGMAHSLEIRVPFVDAHLLKSLAPLLAAPRPPGKTHIAHCPTEPLPRAVRERGKTGFSVPVRQWLLDQGQTYTSERGLRGWSKRVGAAWPRPPIAAFEA